MGNRASNNWCNKRRGANGFNCFYHYCCLLLRHRTKQVLRPGANFRIPCWLLLLIQNPVVDPHLSLPPMPETIHPVGQPSFSSPQFRSPAFSFSLSLRPPVPLTRSRKSFPCMSNGSDLRHFHHPVHPWAGPGGGIELLRKAMYCCTKCVLHSVGTTDVWVRRLSVGH